MITTNDKAIYDRLMRLRWMGITRDAWSRTDILSQKYSWTYDVVEVGYKYHMSDIAAAIGLVQLRKLHSTNARRRALVERYNQALAGIGDIQTPVRKPYQTLPACHNYVIRTQYRDRLNEYLKERGIATSVHYIPNNLYNVYRQCRGETPVAHSEWKKLLTLPLFVDLTDQQLDYIAETIREFFDEVIR